MEEGWLPPDFTPRELRVLTALANGYSNLKIAELQGYALRSVENTVQEIYRKLGFTPQDPEVSPRVRAARHYWEVVYRGPRSRSAVIPAPE